MFIYASNLEHLVEAVPVLTKAEEYTDLWISLDLPLNYASCVPFNTFIKAIAATKANISKVIWQARSSADSGDFWLKLATALLRSVPNLDSFHCMNMYLGGNEAAFADFAGALASLGNLKSVKFLGCVIQPERRTHKIVDPILDSLRQLRIEKLSVSPYCFQTTSTDSKGAEASSATLRFFKEASYKKLAIAHPPRGSILALSGSKSLVDLDLSVNLNEDLCTQLSIIITETQTLAILGLYFQGVRGQDDSCLNRLVPAIGRNRSLKDLRWSFSLHVIGQYQVCSKGVQDSIIAMMDGKNHTLCQFEFGISGLYRGPCKFRAKLRFLCQLNALGIKSFLGLHERSSAYTCLAMITHVLQSSSDGSALYHLIRMAPAMLSRGVLPMRKRRNIWERPKPPKKEKTSHS